MKWITEVSIVLLLAIYLFLAGAGFNVFVLWVYLALFFSLAWSYSFTTKDKPKTAAFWGFLLGSNLFMLPMHVSWYLDIDGARVGSSTSALIFAVMPLWAFVFGGIVGGISKVLNKKAIIKSNILDVDKH